MHKEIAIVTLLLVCSLTSCGLKKAPLLEELPLGFKESSWSYYIAGEPGVLVKQQFLLELDSPSQDLILDSLVLPYGRVELKPTSSQVWEGLMFWNFVEEAQANDGDSATVYGSIQGVLFRAVISLKREEDIYLPSETSH
jgi:hypothetical protein